MIYLGQAIANILVVSYVCNLSNILYRLFPTEVRYTCTAVVINLTVAIFGGTAPILAHLLITRYHFKTMPGLYLIIGAVIGFLVLRTLKDQASNKKKGLVCPK